MTNVAVEAHRPQMAPIIAGVVSEGQQLGRTLGFPTANLAIEAAAVAFGVYVVTVKLADGRIFDGVANLGHRPTVGAPGPILESHLFDFHEDLYGQMIEVAIWRKLREEQRFDGLPDLKRQIERDCRAARAYCARSRRNRQVWPD